MNRLFILKIGSLEYRGLISPGELPDLTWAFNDTCARHGMKAEYHKGVFHAEKDGLKVTLTIGQVCQSRPSRCLEDVLDELSERL